MYVLKENINKFNKASNINITVLRGGRVSVIISDQPVNVLVISF